MQVLDQKLGKHLKTLKHGETNRARKHDVRLHRVILVSFLAWRAMAEDSDPVSLVQWTAAWKTKLDNRYFCFASTVFSMPSPLAFFRLANSSYVGFAYQQRKQLSAS